MKSENYYLRAIAIELGADKPTGHKNNNWYLRKIMELTEGMSDETIEEDLLA